MMEQRLGMELGPFSSVYEAFDSPTTTSMTARTSDIERQLIDEKLMLMGEDGMPLKPTRVKPSPLHDDATWRGYGT
nr:hypothetical protein [Tanacetum cinerariifolium]